MARKSEQHPRPPVGADSFIYDPELAAPEPPAHLTAIPEGALAEKLRLLIAVEAVFERILFVFIIGFGLCLAALMFAQVVLRYVFASPFVGIEELSLLFGAWFYFLGIAYVTRNGEHIHGGILTMVVANRNAIRAVRLAMTVLGIAACMLFGYYAIKYALFEIQTGRLSSYMRWPKGWWSASLIFGFVGTAAYMVLQAVNQAVDLTAHLRGRSGE
ncbi:MAG: TRAP transporter small permease subunit [Rhodospirillaceae bacterium]|nr:TRAP transporter small permease subunit [Rhodospirillaceae bacterium]